MSISSPVTAPREVADPQLSIIVPCYQEEQSLPAFHVRIRALMARLPVSSEVLYVDDGSRDGSVALLERLRQETGVRCLFLSRNFGKEAALCAGIDHARGQALVFIDADLQDPPELIEHMVAHWREGFEVVNMQRRRRTGDSWFKRTTARLYYRMMGVLVERMRIPSDVSDFRLIGPAPLAALRAMDERSRMLKGLVGWVGFKTIELPYERTARRAGSSKFNFLGLLDLAISGVLGFSRKPLRWFSLASLLIWVAAVVYILVALVGGTLDAHHLLIGLGAFLCLGVAMVGEYLGATLSEVKRRPHYLLKGQSTQRSSRAHKAQGRWS
ncbi:glycosyltransferase [Pseudomonas tructae]|uniref:Glycosyltransferase n=1 Tax=Pseudomonas tructae TaxID=2518644 RepID=A0A411MGU1_9PSED|nr:glycosyltransferase family 2 protein [Pseudomonas tructae]QBF26086.1 glycosyltransferase [Pseudomonas tructae]